MFCVDRAKGHARAARACAGALVRKLDAAVSELGEASAASDAAAARALRALGSGSEAPFEHALRWACHHLARAPFAEAEAALVCSASYLRWRVDADQTRELVADAQRAAGGSRDAFLARDAIVLARQVVATYGAAWLHDQLWVRLEPFVEGDEAPGVARLARDARARGAEELGLIAASAMPGVEPAGGALRATLEGHTGFVFAVECYDTGDGLCVVSGGIDGIRSWDGDAGGAPLMTFEAGEVTSLAIYGEGDARRIVSCGREGVQVWDAVAPNSTQVRTPMRLVSWLPLSSMH